MNSIEKTDLVIGVVKNDRDRVLLIGRVKEEDFGDERTLSLTFPSGKVEPNEDEFVAAEREIREETGYIVHASDLIFSGMHDFAKLRVAYVACDIDNFDRNHEKDPAIGKVLWIARTELVRTVPTAINSAVLDYLEL